MPLIDIDDAADDPILAAIAAYDDADRIHLLWEISARADPSRKGFGAIIVDEGLEAADRPRQLEGYVAVVDEWLERRDDLDDEWQSELEARAGHVADAILD
jgi:hypothetical protein